MQSILEIQISYNAWIALNKAKLQNFLGAEDYLLDKRWTVFKREKGHIRIINNNSKL